MTSAPTLLVSGSYFPPQIGGISSMMGDICTRLGRLQSVSALTAVEAVTIDRQFENVRVYRAPSLFRPQSKAALARLGAYLMYLLARERPAVLQYATLEDAYVAHLTKRYFGKPHILYVHGSELIGAASTGWEVALGMLRSAAFVIPSSRFSQGVLREMGIPEQRIRLMHPGCDLDVFRPLPVAPEDRQRYLGKRAASPVILTVGNLVERKGHDTVIRALPRLQALGIDATYLVVGDGPHRHELQALVKATGQEDRVIFAGRVEVADLPLLYSLCDVFAMVSRERREYSDVEGFGIVYIEAAACGKPSVGGRSGGVMDAVQDGVTGVLVDPAAESEVAHALARLLGDRELARRMGEAGLRRATSDFSWDGYVAEVRDLIDEVTAR